MPRNVEEWARVLSLSTDIAKVIIFRGDGETKWKVVRKRVEREYPKPDGDPLAKRGQIGAQSYKSRRRLKFLLRSCEIEWKSILTVTFGDMFPTDGREAALIRKTVINTLERYLGERGLVDGKFTYFWKQEFQSRGAVHWHILLPCEVTTQDIRWWATWWCNYQDKKYLLSRGQVEKMRLFNGLEQVFTDKRGCVHHPVWENERVPGGLSHYVSEYLGKEQQIDPPEWFTNPGRYYGHSGNVKQKPVGEIDVTKQANLGDVARSVMQSGVDGELLQLHQLGADELFLRALLGADRPEFLDLTQTPVLPSLVWGAPPLEVLEGLQGFRYLEGGEYG